MSTAINISVRKRRTRSYVGILREAGVPVELRQTASAGEAEVGPVVPVE